MTAPNDAPALDAPVSPAVSPPKAATFIPIPNSTAALLPMTSPIPTAVDARLVVKPPEKAL